MPRLTIKYFSVIRDLTGKTGEVLEVEGELKLIDLLGLLAEEHPGLNELLKEDAVIVLVNGQPARLDEEVGEEAEIALIPPVSGGSLYEGIVAKQVSHEKILSRTIESLDERTGAVVLFLGIVKGVVNNTRVLELRYEAYEPYASQALQEIAESIGRRYGLHALVIHHAVGSKLPGEETVAIVAAARSRDEAFKGAIEALERVKTEPPIFKLEITEDGNYWVIGDKRIKQGLASSDLIKALKGDK